MESELLELLRKNLRIESEESQYYTGANDRRRRLGKMSFCQAQYQ